jgi:hypothetical protein
MIQPFKGITACVEKGSSKAEEGELLQRQGH